MPRFGDINGNALRRFDSSGAVDSHATGAAAMPCLVSVLHHLILFYDAAFYSLSADWILSAETVTRSTSIFKNEHLISVDEYLFRTRKTLSRKQFAPA